MDQGSVYVFVRAGAAWTEQAQLTASDGAAADLFGRSVALSGDTVLVGAIHDDVGANLDQGSVSVFTRTGGTWTQQAKLTASDGAPGDGFGVIAALGGDSALVGAYRDGIGSNVNQGSAYVFAGFGPTPGTLTLDPPTATNPVGSQHCVTATVEDAAGNPVADVTVRFTVIGAVNTGGSATTDAGGDAVFCYTGPITPGQDAITAWADTNDDNVQDPGEPGGAATKTWVLPASTPLCDVTGGGWIIAANGGRANFGGHARSSETGQTNGQLQYQDRGPAQRMNVHSLNVQAIGCVSSMEVQVYGQATINGAGTFSYLVELKDFAEPGAGHDTYRLRLQNGYDSGEQVLQGGNVQIPQQ